MGAQPAAQPDRLIGRTLAVQRLNMVDSQVRPSDITDRRIIRAMSSVPREAFVPAHLQSLAYTDNAVPLTRGSPAAPQRMLIEPRLFAKLVQLADVADGGRVLEIGCGTGYGVAVLAAMGCRAIGLENDIELIKLAERGLVRAAVDVTGFGLLGHLGTMCRSSHVGAEISTKSLPVISKEVFDLIAADCIPGGSRDNLAYANRFTEWDQTSNVQKTLLTDAQTSGGLLLAVPQKHLEAVVKWLIRLQAPCAAVIGHIVRSAKPKIRVGP